MRGGLSRGVGHLDHFEPVLRRAAIRTHPGVGDIRPAGTRRNSVFGQTQSLVISDTTSVAHDALQGLVVHAALLDDCANRSVARDAFITRVTRYINRFLL